MGIVIVVYGGPKLCLIYKIICRFGWLRQTTNNAGECIVVIPL